MNRSLDSKDLVFAADESEHPSRPLSPPNWLAASLALLALAGSTFVWAANSVPCGPGTNPGYFYCGPGTWAGLLVVAFIALVLWALGLIAAVWRLILGRGRLWAAGSLVVLLAVLVFVVLHIA